MGGAGGGDGEHERCAKEAMEAAVRRAVRKLIHTPTVKAKEAASQGDEDVLTAARFLFGIEARDEPEQE